MVTAKDRSSYRAGKNTTAPMSIAPPTSASTSAPLFSPPKYAVIAPFMRRSESRTHQPR
jgi:hypothetical protein